MDKEIPKEKLKWYDSGHFITNLLIVCIVTIIIVTQSFTVTDFSSLKVFGSIINHNSVYLLVLIYFITLKFHFGKKYFNYLNLFLIFIYALATVTSFLTLIQSFSLDSVLAFILNCLFLIYSFHTFFRDTRIWHEYKLFNSPFNEITNDWLFYAVIVVGVFLLAVKLINTVVISGVILSTLDIIYYVLFGRYIYLYRDYLDSKKLDSDNAGNFDVVREKIQNVLDKTEIDEKIIEVKDKIVDTAKDLEKKISSVDEVKGNVVENNLTNNSGKTNDGVLEESIDEKKETVNNENDVKKANNNKEKDNNTKRVNRKKTKEVDDKDKSDIDVKGDK